MLLEVDLERTIKDQPLPEVAILVMVVKVVLKMAPVVAVVAVLLLFVTQVHKEVLEGL